jgi:hypothetical protein
VARFCKQFAAQLKMILKLAKIFLLAMFLIKTFKRQCGLAVEKVSF